MADVRFTNQDGKSVSLYQFKGKYVLLNFVFTRCPMADMCPLTMTLSRRLIEDWKTQALVKRRAAPLEVLAVTLDPEHDTPPVMKAYAQAHGMDFEHFAFLTASPPTLETFAAQFNLIAVATGKTISHNVKSVLLNPQMIKIKEYKDNSWTSAEILSEMKSSLPWGLFALGLTILIAFLSLIRKLARTSSSSEGLLGERF
jgi:protein SCO1